MKQLDSEPIIVTPQIIQDVISSRAVKTASPRCKDSVLPTVITNDAPHGVAQRKSSNALVRKVSYAFSAVLISSIVLIAGTNNNATALGNSGQTPVVQKLLGNDKASPKANPTPSDTKDADPTPTADTTTPVDSAVNTVQQVVTPTASTPTSSSTVFPTTSSTTQQPATTATASQSTAKTASKASTTTTKSLQQSSPNQSTQTASTPSAAQVATDNTGTNYYKTSMLAQAQRVALLQAAKKTALSGAVLLLAASALTIFWVLLRRRVLKQQKFVKGASLTAHVPSS